jgi:hypothetical protein
MNLTPHLNAGIRECDRKYLAAELHGWHFVYNRAMFGIRARPLDSMPSSSGRNWAYRYMSISCGTSQSHLLR